MRLLLLAACTVLVLSLLCAAGPRSPAVVVLPGAEDVKDTANTEGSTTTYVVRDPYPSSATATRIEEMMSTRGWTLLRKAPDVAEEHRLDGATLLRFRMQAKDLESFNLLDISSVHFTTQAWIDNGGNLVLYLLNRPCTHEAAGLHSTYVNVSATYRSSAQWKALRVRMNHEAESLPASNSTP